MLSNSLIELVRAHLVHRVASYRSHERAGVRVLKSAVGATVTDANGHQMIDGFAGLWCVNAGYGQESIVEAATRQLRELPYATRYFGLGSEPAIHGMNRSARDPCSHAGRCPKNAALFWAICSSCYSGNRLLSGMECLTIGDFSTTKLKYLSMPIFVSVRRSMIA